ncbi:MAG: DMT family transporter [Burkholderiaceae bacterium]
MNDDDKPLTAAASTLAVGLCALWGLGQIAMKVATTGMSPVFLAGARSLIAALLLMAWIAIRRLPVYRRDGTLGWGVLAGLVFALEFVCLFIGLQYTQAARATLMLYSAPFFVAIGTHWLVPNDRISATRLGGLACAFVGLIVAFFDRLGTADALGLLGDALCLGAAALWGMTTVLIKATPLRSLLPEKNLLYQLGVSAIALLALAALLGEPGLHAPSPRVIASFLYVTVIIAGASYLAWFGLVSRYRATTLHAFTFLTPVFGVVAARLLLDEPITAALAIALVLIATGIVLVNRG